MHKALIRLIAPPGAAGNLSILIFHRVTPQPDPLFAGEVDAARFDSICSWVKRWYQVLPLGKAVQCLRDHCLPARALAITFDDGYADNHDVALPILQRHGLPATFFIASGFLDGGCMWNDCVVEAIRHYRGDMLDLPDHLPIAGHRLELGSWASKRRAIDQVLSGIKYQAPHIRAESAISVVRAAAGTVPVDLMMSSRQVANMTKAGMTVGGHTVGHPILAHLSESEAFHELQLGRTTLESITQAPVDLLAYPNGQPDVDYARREVMLAARAGFKAAVSTAPGVSRVGADLFQLPRFTPWDRSQLRFGLRLALNVRTTVRLTQLQTLG